MIDLIFRSIFFKTQKTFLKTPGIARYIFIM